LKRGSENELCSQLALPGYHINSSGKLVIESKRSLQERGEKSPDDADSFLLTFARNVAPQRTTPIDPPRVGWGNHQAAWME